MVVWEWIESLILKIMPKMFIVTKDEPQSGLYITIKALMYLTSIYLTYLGYIATLQKF